MANKISYQTGTINLSLSLSHCIIMAKTGRPRGKTPFVLWNECPQCDKKKTYNAKLCKTCWWIKKRQLFFFSEIKTFNRF